MAERERATMAHGWSIYLSQIRTHAFGLQAPGEFMPAARQIAKWRRMRQRVLRRMRREYHLQELGRLGERERKLTMRIGDKGAAL